MVTLLLGNACANEALPIFLDKLVPSEVAILVSVTCVLIFGEILPSALMLGPRQLMLAAALAPAVRGLMIITSPLSVPIARLLILAGADISNKNNVRSPCLPRCPSHFPREFSCFVFVLFR